MAAYISFQPSEYFNTKIYTQSGGANNGATQTISLADVGLTWIKNRDYTNSYCVFDTIRGGSGSECLLHSSTNAAAQGSDVDSSEGLTFGASSTTIGTDGGGYGYNNRDGDKYVAWSWRGGTTSGITTNGSTTITPSSYSFNQTSGFSVVRYTGNGTSGAKIAHGLGTTPDLVIVKRLAGGSGEWDMVSKHLGATYYLRFTQDDKATGTWAFNDTLPDSVNFTVGDNAETNSSNGNVAYCFASIKGYSKIGLYKGNANADGTFVYTGFRPAIVIMKNLASSEDWHLYDNKRANPFNIADKTLDPNNTNAEYTISSGVDFLSNGFKWRASASALNGSSNYIYMSFGEAPLVSSNGKAGVAR